MDVNLRRLPQLCDIKWKFLVPLADERMYPLQPDKVAIQSKQRKELSYNISKFHNSYDKNYNFLSGNLQPKWEWYMIEKNNQVKDNNERFKRDKSRN